MFADSYHKTRSAALAEVQRRRAQTRTEQLITKIEDSPYGGYRVRSIPAEFFLDNVNDVTGIAGFNKRTKLFA